MSEAVKLWAINPKRDTWGLQDATGVNVYGKYLSKLWPDMKGVVLGSRANCEIVASENGLTISGECQ